MSAPYIPFYIDDFDGATAHLTATQEGIYMRLLKTAWRTPRCELPNDVAWIARKCRVQVTQVEPILREFFHLKRGRWVQTRLKAEHQKIADKKRERSEAGRKGGTNRGLKQKGKTSSKANVLLKQPEPEVLSKERTDGGHLKLVLSPEAAARNLTMPEGRAG